MNQLHVNYELDETKRKCKTAISTGDTSEFSKDNSRKGIAAIFASLTTSGSARESTYQDFLQRITRNTGYPQTPYVPEQWEIPFTNYDETTLVNDFRAVKHWGTDNCCLIVNHISGLTPENYRTVSAAVLINLNEEGLCAIPVYCDENGTPKAHLDLTTFLPLGNIKRLQIITHRPQQLNFQTFRIGHGTSSFVKEEYHTFVVTTTDGKTQEYYISNNIENADFHAANYQKLLEICRR